MRAPSEEQTIRQYLLGLLPQRDLAQVEERVLTDKAFYEELLIAEDELTDQYLLHELTEPERQRFETYFLLTPERQQKVRFSSALRKYVSLVAKPGEKPVTEKSSAEESGAIERAKKRPPFSFLFAPNPVLSFSLASAALLLVFGTLFLVSKRSGHPEQRQVLTIVLTPGLVREGGETKKFAIPAGIDTVQFRLELSLNEYQSYRSVLEDADSRVVVMNDNLRVESGGVRTVVVTVAANSMPPGDYQLKLSGITASGSSENVSRYSFRVLSR